MCTAGRSTDTLDRNMIDKITIHLYSCIYMYVVSRSISHFVSINTFFTHVAPNNTTSSSEASSSKLGLSSRKRMRQEFNEKEHSISETSYQTQAQLLDFGKTSLVKEQNSAHGNSDFDTIDTSRKKKRRKEKNKRI